MEVTQRHAPTVPSPAYAVLKPALRRAGLFSCSEVGFNLALDPLARQQARVAAWLASAGPQVQGWAAPPLLRTDWAVGAWHNPPPAQWCREEPGGHLLTPRPLLHLLNRLRWHPTDTGEWVLGSWCFRQEDPALTLPLLRQRAFYMVEHAWVGALTEAARWAAHELERWWELAVRLDLPVALSASEHARYDAAVLLELPDTPAASLAHAEVLPVAASGAYLKEGQACAAVGLGLERWLLALAARYGAHVEDWPELPG
jgi:hypothetical protein